MIRVLTERRCKPGQQRALENLLKDLRATAMQQSGYISGETLAGLDDPTSYLVISTWTNPEAWKRWQHSRSRLEVVHLISSLLIDEPSIRIYGPPFEEE